MRSVAILALCGANNSDIEIHYSKAYLAADHDARSSLEIAPAPTKYPWMNGSVVLIILSMKAKDWGMGFINLFFL